VPEQIHILGLPDTFRCMSILLHSGTLSIAKRRSWSWAAPVDIECGCGGVVQDILRLPFVRRPRDSGHVLRVPGQGARQRLHKICIKDGRVRAGENDPLLIESS
jgi:hypothetical protein